MNLIGRQDRVLVAGLAVALMVVFSRQVQYLLDLAQEVERSMGVALVLPLIILTVIFVLHQQGKHQESRAQALSAEAVSHDALARAAELERLMTFGQALGRSLDIDELFAE